MKKDISKHTKTNKLLNAVIEIDEVEFLIDETANQAILDGKKSINLKRLIDKNKIIFSIDEINLSIKKNGIIDYL